MSNEPKENPTDSVGVERLVMALDDLLKYADMNTCRHDETHRGGTLWTICDQCGMKWADDEGGMPKYEEPQAIATARHILLEAKRHNDKMSGRGEVQNG